MITLRTYESFRTARAAERENSATIGTLQNDQCTIISITNYWEKVNKDQNRI